MEEGIIYGTCRFCGQLNSNPHSAYKTQEQADECATLSCNCWEARRNLEKLQAKKQEEEEREQAIKRAEEQIESLFGSGAAEYGLLEVETKIKELILSTSTMVYDRLLKDLTININSRLKVKISKSPKGKLIFARSDATVVKQEA